MDVLKYSQHRELMENAISFANSATNNVHVKAFKNVIADLAGLDTIDFAKSVELLKKDFQDTPFQKHMEKIFEKLEPKHLANSIKEGGLVQILTKSFTQLEDEFTQELGPEFMNEFLNVFFKKRDKIIAAAIRDEKKQDEAMEKCKILMHDFQNIQDNESFPALKKEFLKVLSDLESGDEYLKLLMEMYNEFEDNPDVPKEGMAAMKLNIADMQNDFSKKIEAAKVAMQMLEEIVVGVGPLHEGNCDEHALFLLDTLQSQETQLGSEHPSTLLTKSKLALLYDKVGELDKALPLLDVELCERKLGLEHPVTLSTLSTLVSVMEKQKKFKEVLALSKKILKIKKQALRPNHPDTLATMYNIGVAYYNIQDYKSAVRVAQDILLLCEKDLREDHQVTIKTKELLKDSKENLEKQSDALAKFLEFTGADDKIGQKHLDASNWNLTVALDNFWSSIPDQEIDDSKLQELPLVMLQGNPAKNIQNDEVGNFLELTNTNERAAQGVLRKLNHKMQVAPGTSSGLNANDSMATLEMEDLATTSTQTNPHENNQKDKIANFIDLTNTNEEVAESLLKESSWSMQVDDGIASSINRNDDMATSEMQNLAKTLSLTTLHESNQEDEIANFIEFTNTNEEDALSLLLESNWNTQVALTTFLELNGEEKLAPVETPNLGINSYELNPDENNQNQKVMKFIELTYTDEEVALFLLRDANWNTEVAVDTFWQLSAKDNMAASKIQPLATTSLQSKSSPGNDNKEDIVVEITKLTSLAQSLLTDASSFIQDAVKTCSELHSEVQNIATTLVESNSDKKDKVENFIKFTNTNEKVARRFLGDSNWNTEVAVETYLKSNRNENISESEELNMAFDYLLLPMVAYREPNLT